MSADEGSRSDPKDESDASRRERSSVEFPYMDLATACEVASAVFNRNGGGDVQSDELAAQLRLSPTSSGFRTKIATARAFGLVASARGADAITLTELGMQAVDSATARKAKAEAFLRIPLYKIIYESFKGNQLPPTAALERRMLEWGVVPKQTERARQVFERSAEQAGYFGSGRDRLVRPARLDAADTVNPQSAAAPPIDHDQKARTRGNGSDGNLSPGDIHPAVLGILQILPKVGTPWTVRQRAKWLSSLNNVLDLIYDSDDGHDHDIIIEVKSGK